MPESRRLSFPFAMAVLAGSAAAQTTWYVDAAAVPPGNGTPASPFASIQYAHDQPTTLSGDVLSIAPGTYGEPLSFTQGKALRLVGAGLGSTFLDGGLQVLSVPGTTRFEDLTFREEELAFHLSTASFERVRITQVDDFTDTAVTLSLADSSWVDVTFDANAHALFLVGAYSATLTRVTFSGNGGQGAPALWGLGATLSLTECAFTGNHLVEGSGAALRLENCLTTVVDTTFMGNSATLGGSYGGAVVQDGGLLAIGDCVFEDNVSNRGGALALLGTAEATMDGVTFEGNRALGHGLGNDYLAQGGAVWIALQAKLTADACTFRANTAAEDGPTSAEEELGGAVFGGGSVFPGIPTSTYSDCLFEANVAAQDGSAVFGASNLIRCKVLGNVNTDVGGTLRYAWLDRCTVVGNTPTGVGGVVLRDGYVESSILWANAGASLAGSTWGGYSCIEGGALGPGMIDADPQFTNLAQADLTLAPGSPCIDTGSPSAPLDADLTPADMGALPFTWLPMGASYCGTHPNSSGLTAAIAALGSPKVADDFLRVQATQTAVNQVGLFMMSQNQGFVPLFNGSQGNLCVSAPIFRLTNTPGSVSSTGSLGLLNLRVGLTTLPAGLQVLPGQTWHFQAWFRDHVGGQSTSNTTNAVSITFQ